MKKVAFLFVACLLSCGAFAQNKLLDSLYSILQRNNIHDTIRVLVSVEIATNEYVVNPDNAMKLSKEALIIARKNNYKTGEGYCYRALGLIYSLRGDYKAASEYGFRMLKIFDSLNHKGGIARSYGLLGHVHHEWRNVEKAMEYYKMEIKLYDELGNITRKGYTLNSIASLFVDRGNLDSALLFYNESLKLREEIHDEQGMSQSYNNIGLIYSRKGNYEEAIKYFNKSLPLTRKLKNNVRLAITLRSLGETYMRMKNYKMAELILVEALKQTKMVGNKMGLLEVNETLAQFKEEQNLYKEALYYDRQKRAYQDSMFNEEKARQLAEMEARYENEKKQQTIELLTRDNKIKTIWRNLLVAAFTLSVIGFALIYQFQKFKATKNKTLLSVKIDLLTSQNATLAEKYKQAILATDDNSFESQDQRLLKRSLEVVERNISDPLFGVEKMAEELGMSRANLHRRLKTVSNFPPSDFIRNVRLKRAATLLKNKVDNISQIGLMVGFDDASNFAKVFKKAYGVSPSEYAENSVS